MNEKEKRYTIKEQKAYIKELERELSELGQ